MAQREEVTFEVLLLSNGRWEAQGVYESNQQGLAVSDAKSLARVSTVQGVKVVKEFYDAKAGASRSLTVFEHKPGQGSASRGPGAAQTRRGGAGDEAPSEALQNGNRPRGNSIFMVIVKILLSLCFALLTAIVLTRLAAMVLRDVHKLGPLSHADLLNFIFLLVFVIISLGMVTRVLVNVKKLGGIIPLGSGRANSARPTHVRNPHLTPQAELKKRRSKAEEKFLEEQEKAAEEARAAQAEKKQAEDEARKAEEDARRAEEEARQKAMQETDQKAEADALSEIITMKAFTDDAFEVLDGTKEKHEKQDAHTVFGLVLFLVGAVQSMRSERHLPDAIANTVMHKALGSAGLSKERIDHFIESIDDYLISNPSYSQMFQAGREAMGVYLESNTGPRLAFSEALDTWKKPRAASARPNQPITVLFTDIAGSTAMTQTLGDAGAQDVVRIHNQIVRDAIKTFSGREIKHTGDGIMASFPSAAQGVEAAMDMQEHTQKHNESAGGKERPLGLKIGLNIGDPISEEDDLYGTTVQLAARIVDKAEAGEILVSSSIHGLSQGKNLKFERGPDFEMEGFDGPVTTYFAVWDGHVPRKPEPEPEAEKPVQVKPEPTATSQPVAQPSQSAGKLATAPAVKKPGKTTAPPRPVQNPAKTPENK